MRLPTGLSSEASLADGNSTIGVRAAGLSNAGDVTGAGGSILEEGVAIDGDGQAVHEDVDDP
jgi:hypothetical protein